MSDLAAISLLQDEIISLQVEKDASQKIADGISAELEKKKSLMLKILVDAKLDSFKTEAGSISVNRRFQVTVPKGDDLQAFFEFLGAKEPDTAQALRTVNYATLNNWYKEKLEAAGEDAPFLQIPGLKPPTANEYLTVRKGKG